MRRVRTIIAALVIAAIPVVASLWLRAAQAGPNANPAVSELIRDLDDDSRWVRLEAAYALGKIGPPAGAAVPQLLDTMSDKYADVRYFAVRALGRIGAEADVVVPELSTLLEDGEDEVRTAAAMSLGDFGARAAETLPCLRQRANVDPYKNARRFADMAVEEIEIAMKGRAGVAKNDPNRKVRRPVGKDPKRQQRNGLAGAWIGRYDYNGWPNINGLEFTPDGRVTSICRNPLGIAWNNTGSYDYEDGRLIVVFFGQGPVQPVIRWNHEDQFVYSLAGVTITFDRVEGPMTPERLLNEPLPTRQVLPDEEFFEQVLESMSGE